MSTIETMSNVELSTLLAEKVMGWVKFETPYGSHWKKPTSYGVYHSVAVWNPCRDYNHLRQVEEKLTDEQWKSYSRVKHQFASRVFKVLGHIGVDLEVDKMKARQRCECIARAIATEKPG